MKNQNININSLLSESSISVKMKNNISQKFNTIVTVIEEIHKNKNTENFIINDELLSKEIKASAKILIRKSDTFEKEIIESTLKQKEESIEMLEISKLRIEAQIKELEKRKMALTLKNNNSFFHNLKTNFFKIFNFNLSKKYSKKPLSLESKLDNFNLKLSNYDLEKDKLSKNFYENGTAKLASLRNHTYHILATSKTDVTTDKINSIKTKIKNFN